MQAPPRPIVLRDRKVLRLESAISWAVAIEPALLGATLQTYGKVGPTIRFLRWCNRYGVGPDGCPAAVARLPVEVVEMIPGAILQISRKHSLMNWEQFMTCAGQEHCTAYGVDTAHRLWHLGPEQVPNQIQQFSDIFCRKCKIARPCTLCQRLIKMDLPAVNEDEEYRLQVAEWIRSVPIGVPLQHVVWRDLWKRAVKSGYPFGDVGEQILTRFFGLKTWTALLRVFSLTDYAEEHTVVYLVPSNTTTYRTQCALPKMEADDLRLHEMRLHLAVPLNNYTVDDQAMVKRFARAMRILCIEPTYGPYTFQQSNIFHYMDPNSNTQYIPDRSLAPQQWPCLMSLCRTSYNEEPPNDQSHT